MVLAIFGVILGFLLALFVRPLVQPHVDKLLAKSPLAFRRKRSISGLWAQTWHVDSDNYPDSNPSEIFLRQIGGSVSGRLIALNRIYRVEGTAEGDYFTGIW